MVTPGLGIRGGTLRVNPPGKTESKQTESTERKHPMAKKKIIADLGQNQPFTDLQRLMPKGWTLSIDVSSNRYYAYNDLGERIYGKAHFQTVLTTALMVHAGLISADNKTTNK